MATTLRIEISIDADLDVVARKQVTDDIREAFDAMFVIEGLQDIMGTATLSHRSADDFVDYTWGVHRD
jgi:hypothetical protein